jgi:hemoglobin
MDDKQTTPYKRVGEDAGVRALVQRFYEYMDTLPEARGIRGLHPADLGSSRDKLYEFLSGWLGGPPLYMQRRGHPRLRMRHLPFPIGDSERDQWLMCMDNAMRDCIDDAPLRDILGSAFRRMAGHLRNTADFDRDPAQ